MLTRKTFSLFILIILVLLLKSNIWAYWPFGRSEMSMMGRMMGMSPDKGANEMCPMMGRMPVTGIGREDLPEPESSGAELYSKYCRQCHALPSPKAHSAREWEESFRKMDVRMQMMGRMKMMRMCRMMNIEAPDAKEKEIILVYLQKYALKVIKREDLPSPESKGALVFKDTCSQCHDLPAPQNHTPEEWPLIVEKMEDIIKDWEQGNPLSDKDKKRITRYLQEYSE